MSYDLKTLAQHREALLLAEAAAWLHDMGKCADAFLQPGGIGFNAINCRGRPRANPHKAILEPSELRQLPYWSQLSSDRGQCVRLEETQHNTALWRTLQGLSIPPSLLNSEIDLGHLGKTNIPELILWGRPLVADHYGDFQGILTHRIHLIAVLGQSHSTAHMEKEDVADGGTSDWISSPFGTVQLQIQNLDQRLHKVLLSFGKPRGGFIVELSENFRAAPGDTRRPINEVTLWDWSSTVAALYKAEIARCVLLNGKRQPGDVKWRLLSLRTDGLEYLLGTSSIPDLLAHKGLLNDALSKVQMLLEETYPLGLEVYRDENGSLFVVPDVEQLEMTLVDAIANKNLHQLILESFAQGTIRGAHNLHVDGEIVPEIYVDPTPWKGQPAPQELPPVGKHLGRKTRLEIAPERVADAWRYHQGEICTVCGLRPQGPSSKSQDRGVCDTCEQRRTDRAKAWTGELETTIWTDEVADTNGRLALIMGRFDLTGWLNGSLVQTLTVVDPANASSKTVDDVAKNPSFARIRRVWETTRTFWQDVLPTDEDSQDDKVEPPLVGQLLESAGFRLEIIPQGRDELDLDNFHTYELVLPGDVRLSVVWDRDSDKCRFITCDNLDYLAKPEQLGKPVQDVLSEGRTLTVEEPIGYGGENKVWGEITLAENAQELPGEYTPAIPILAEPRTFMALVPADKALDAIQAIKQKYEREMGKVRNRLPLHLGAVYFHRRTPLRAALDAGRRMLAFTSVADGGWKVTRVAD